MKNAYNEAKISSNTIGKIGDALKNMPIIQLCVRQDYEINFPFKKIFEIQKNTQKKYSESFLNMRGLCTLNF